MMKPIFAVFATQIFSRISKISRGTWLAIGLGLLTLFILTIWAAISLLGWVWGQGKSLGASTPAAMQAITTQVEQVLPGARQSLGEWIPSLKPEEPLRDVSGSDIGPVTRYPGLVRTYWQRDGNALTVRYEGTADYASVLNHYVQGFTALGYTQNLHSAASSGEQHTYQKNEQHLGFAIERQAQGKVKVTLNAPLPTTK